MDTSRIDGNRAANGRGRGRVKDVDSPPRNRSTARSNSRPSSKSGPVSRSPTPKKEARTASRTPSRKNSRSSSRPSSRDGPSTSPGRRGRATNANRSNSPVKKESQSPTQAARRAKSRSASSSSDPSHKKNKKKVPLYDDLPDATEESCSTFQVIPECLYGSKHMGSTDVDPLDCDCQEQWRDGINHACGEDSDCINRATKMECVTDAGNCGAGCQNQRFQRKQFADVSVVKTDKKGFGLRANKDMPANDFIFEYIGEVINEPTFRRRMMQYDEEGIKHFYFMSLTKHEFVDATKKGNLGRFCNHSCNPNCYVDKWVVGDKLRMGIFTSRAVEAGEELVFNYNVDRYGAEPQPCYCGESNCVGYIGGKTQTERGTKLSIATVEALGIDDGSSWDTAVAKKPRKKKPEEDDEEYVSRLEARGLDEVGASKVMAQLMQCKEKWIAVKLLQRIQRCEDANIINSIMRMHGYQILKAVLTTFIDDNNVVMQVLRILDRFPRETRNKIQDSNIEVAVRNLVGREGHDEVSTVSKRLLDEWEKLPVGYRIARRKAGAPAASNPFEERRNMDRQDPKAKEDPIGSDVPKGPRSNVPQRNNNFFGGPRPPKKRFNGPPLPQGWFSATDERGNLYYYSKGGATRWDRPTEPAPVVQKSADIAKQRAAMLQNIIEQVTKEQPRQQLTPKAATPQPAEAPAAASRRDWRDLPIDKQMKIYENTIHKHIKSVVDRYKTRFPKDVLKKYFKEITKMIVHTEYQRKRVDDPTEITRDQARNFKVKVKDFLDKAIVKERKAALRNAGLAAPTSVTTAVSAGDDKAEVEADSTPVDVVMSDIETGSVSSQERKRKRGAEDVEMPSPMREASETPSAKRFKDDDVDIATPPPPPPPPAATNAEAEGSGFLTAEQIALIEQEQALMRENEEAERLEKIMHFTSGLVGDQPTANGHTVNGDTLLSGGQELPVANMDQHTTQ